MRAGVEVQPVIRKGSQSHPQVHWFVFLPALIAVAITALLLSSHVRSASAALLFSDGFEAGNFSSWTSVTVQGSATATVQQSVVKSGAYAARLSSTTTSGSRAYVRKDLDPDQADIEARGAFNVQSEGSSGGNVPFLRVFNSSGSRIASLYRQNVSGGLWVAHSGVYYSTGRSIALWAWYDLSLHVRTGGAGSGAVEVRLDGTLVYATNAASLGTSPVATVQIGNETAAQAYAIRIDDVAISVPGSATPSPTATPSSPTPTASPPSTSTGYRDFSFGSGTSSPTGEKPQSKLWFNDGIWWGSLFDDDSERFTIHRLDWSTQKWTNTGVVIDERNSSKADVMWTGSKLYVASAGPSTSTAHSPRVLRYTYRASTKTYTLDSGFPVQPVSGGMEAIVLARDTTGKLWITYTRGGKVFVTHSTSSDSTWVKPYVIPVAGANNLDPDDISAIIAYNSRIGVMWSNQNDDTMHFASHADGASDSSWSTNNALSLPGYADDHINLKSLQADASGRIFAAVKTSQTSGSAPLILLLVLKDNGSWNRYTFGRVSDDHTRPIVLIDQENRKLYVFAASPCCSGGVVYYKSTSLDNISFPSGLGTPFIKSSTDPTINNPSSTKQTLNGSTNLVVIASDNASDYYLHNKIDLP
jgi:hypothetical protein